MWNRTSILSSAVLVSQYFILFFIIEGFQEREYKIEAEELRSYLQPVTFYFFIPAENPYLEGTKINSPFYLAKMNNLKGTNRFTLIVSQYEKTNTINYTLKVNQQRFDVLASCVVLTTSKVNKRPAWLKPLNTPKS